MTFLLDEDLALRKKLQGIVVEDQRAQEDGKTRPVGVWFGQPDQEIRDQSYPYVTIDMIGINEDFARSMRGLVAPPYLVPAELSTDQSYLVDMPIPVSIDYQITTYARHPRHDRAIISQLLHSNLLLRFGYLEIPYVDENGDDAVVYRRLDVTGIAKRDVTEQAKRLFVNAITVRVSSEVVQGTLENLYKVRQINLKTILDLTVAGRPGDPNFVSPGESTITA